MIIVVIYIAVLVLMFASLWKIYTKAGQPGWAILVPIYGTLVMLDIIKKPWYWLLLMCIPLVGIYWAISSINLLCKAFGKDTGFTLGCLFLPFIFYPMLGFGDATYILDGESGVDGSKVLDSNVV